MKPIVLRNSHAATIAPKKSATGGIIAPVSMGVVGTEMLVRQVVIAGNRGIGSIPHNLGEGIAATPPFTRLGLRCGATRRSCGQDALEPPAGGRKGEASRTLRTANPQAAIALGRSVGCSAPKPRLWGIVRGARGHQRRHKLASTRDADRYRAC
jgi:hypothetical protein